MFPLRGCGTVAGPVHGQRPILVDVETTNPSGSASVTAATSADRSSRASNRNRLPSLDCPRLPTFVPAFAMASETASASRSALTPQRHPAPLGVGEFVGQRPRRLLLRLGHRLRRLVATDVPVPATVPSQRGNQWSLLTHLVQIRSRAFSLFTLFAGKCRLPDLNWWFTCP